MADISIMTYKIIISLLRAVAHLPLSVLYVFSSIAWPILYYIGRYRRKITRRNLLRSFPDKSLKEIKRIERAFYHNMCNNVVETLKLLHISDEEMHRRVTFTGINLIEKAAEEGHPVFLLSGHYGNWEWTSELTRRIKAPTTCGYIYAPVANETLDKVMKTLRTRCPILLIPRLQAGRIIIRMKQEHDSYFMGFVADQRPLCYSLHHWTTFLNQDTPYMVGAEEIGRRVDAVYLYQHMERIRKGYYKISIEPLEPTEGEEFPYTIGFLRRLEEEIRRCPELWLWSHRRWKYKRGDGC